MYYPDFKVIHNIKQPSISQQESWHQLKYDTDLEIEIEVAKFLHSLNYLIV